MEISVEGQALELLLGLALGVAAGFLYDLLGVFRRRIGLSALTHLLDLLFWLSVIAAVFALYMLAGGGKFRLWTLLFAIVTATLYFLTVSRFTRGAAELLADILAFFFQLLLWPFRQLGRFAKKISLFAKKNFPSSKK